MESMAAKIYSQQYERFQTVLDLLEANQVSQAQARVQELSSYLATIKSPEEALHTSFFIKAFEQRLAGNLDVEENLYLLPDQGQQIQMFRYMAQQFPVVRFAQDIVNERLAQALAKETQLTIWDIGIGNGQQMDRLIHLLAQTSAMDQVSVIGLDPSGDCLDQAESLLKKTCQNHEIRFNFYGIPKTVEALNPEDWLPIRQILEPAQGKWVANASFALHHIRPTSNRTSFFQEIHQLKPALFCLIEPYADFLTPSLKQRFEHAWHHYGLAFWAIDQIEAPIESRNLLKSVFFGREILDVLAKDEGRIEQFETGDMWTARLQEGGFRVSAIPCQEVAIPGFEAIQIQPHKHYTSFNAQNFPIISLLEAH